MGSTPRTALPEQRTRRGQGMVADLVVVPSWFGVSSFVCGPWVSGRYPVVDPRGVLVGILDLAALAARPELHDRLAGEVCVPLVGDLDPGLVVEDGRLIGAGPGPPAPRRLRLAS